MSKTSKNTMNNYYRTLILADEENQWEVSSVISMITVLDDIKHLKTEMDSLFATNLDIDLDVQDASFFTDIGLLDDKHYNRETRNGALIYKYHFRFSNFGKLYTIINNCPEDTTLTKKIELTKQLLSTHKFCFIPVEILNTTYNGKNKLPYKDFTWWHRYFDYV
jgi:hypothetical protein